MPARNAAWQVAAFCVAVLALYAQTAWSIVSIWIRSDTFAHGFLIVPIALWLVWEQRDSLRDAPFRPTAMPLLLILPLGLMWLLASLVDVQVVLQFCFVAVLVVGIWAVVGQKVAARLAFPLGFLFLAVPMGEGLVPPMMELTATSTVWLIQLTGIPVYREGLYFTLPSGNWSVVAACSGVRYLIASFTLGLLYAYLSYHSLYKRLLFIAASLLVPIVANIVRAYGIVMLGHLSNMQLATGVDHLVYGWLFFGLVMFVLFWIGSFGKEKPLPHPANKQQQSEPGSGGIKIMLVAVLLAALWPALALVLERRPATEVGPALLGPVAATDWQQSAAENWSWLPLDKAADHHLVQSYSKGSSTVTLYLQQHKQQRQGEELVASGNRFVQGEQDWRITSKRKLGVKMGSQTLAIDAVDLATASQKLRVWGWYRVGEHYTANAYVAKLYEVAVKLSFGRRDSARLFLATETFEGVDSDKVLEDFLSAHLESIESALDEGPHGVGDE